jgi:hypothetical protein
MQGVFMLKFNRSVFVMLVSLGLLAGGCAGNNQATTETETSPVAESPTTQPSVSASPDTPVATTADAGTTDSHGGQGGQVIETGDYHLELVTAKEADGIHLDLFLQKGDSHEAISDAKVTAQVQSPDGSQQALDMEYDASGEHYTAFLPSSDAGEYNIAVLSDIQGEKVNGRFKLAAE